MGANFTCKKMKKKKMFSDSSMDLAIINFRLLNSITMRIAPNGAVNKIASTAIIKTVVARSWNSVRLFLRTKSNAIGANAACKQKKTFK